MHRYIKPANIVIDKDFLPYITDFDCAKVTNDETDHTRKLGTKIFMASEVRDIRDQAIFSQLADVYSLGLVFYLISETRGTSIQKLTKVLRKKKETDIVLIFNSFKKEDDDYDDDYDEDEETVGDESSNQFITPENLQMLIRKMCDVNQLACPMMDMPYVYFLAFKKFKKMIDDFEKEQLFLEKKSPLVYMEDEEAKFNKAFDETSDDFFKQFRSKV